jgi:hypothetical protein
MTAVPYLRKLKIPSSFPPVTVKVLRHHQRISAELMTQASLPTLHNRRRQPVIAERAYLLTDYYVVWSR